jgi:hypothetical protein
VGDEEVCCVHCGKIRCDEQWRVGGGKGEGVKEGVRVVQLKYKSLRWIHVSQCMRIAFAEPGHVRQDSETEGQRTDEGMCLLQTEREGKG